MGKFFRWIPSQHAVAALRDGMVSHNQSALWVFESTGTYKPGNNITRGAYLLAYEVTDTATTNIKTVKTINFLDVNYVGESDHPLFNIVKDNEPGAYGIGRHRQKTTNLHATTRYARKSEVAWALGLNEREVGVAYRPEKAWGR